MRSNKKMTILSYFYTAGAYTAARPCYDFAEAHIDGRNMPMPNADEGFRAKHGT